MIQRWCKWEECSEPFDGDASTGDGDFCSWECLDAAREYDEEYEFVLIERETA